jgi:hypothetical protein
MPRLRGRRASLPGASDERHRAHQCVSCLEGWPPDRPLRLPAQSLTEERERIWDDKLEPMLLLALFMVVLPAFEWFRHFYARPPTPILMTVVAVIAVALAAWKVFRLRPKMRQLRQAIDGEKAVGQFLERLRESGYVVFHDIVGKGFNIDHVLIGPTGVYTVETKTWSKPADHDARISFNGTTLLAGKLEPDRDPITQAKAQSGWLRSVIAESTGRNVKVFPGHPLPRVVRGPSAGEPQ